MYISKFSQEYRHAEMRILNAVDKATKNGVYDKEKFIKAMVTRLRKMKNDNEDLNVGKVQYTMAVLKDLGATDDDEDPKGYQMVVDIYEGRLTMEILTHGRSSVYG